MLVINIRINKIVSNLKKLELILIINKLRINRIRLIIIINKKQLIIDINILR